MERAEASARPALFTEFCGSLGDLGTFLPLVVASALAAGMDLGRIFVLAGLLNIVTGLIFRQPIPVQPMKALAAVAIVEQLGAGGLAAAGLLMGATLVLLGTLGLAGRVQRWVPVPVVRAIQLGVGLSLALKGLDWLAGVSVKGFALARHAPLPWTGADSLLLAAVAGVLLAAAGRRRPAALLVLFAGGCALAARAAGAPAGAPPATGFSWPDAKAWGDGFRLGFLPQLPLTLLNSVVAVCALSADFFPGRGIRPDRMAASVGLMNLVSVPLGGLPMCHGAGGLAAQHAFGARTGWSVVMLGGVKVAAGLLLGGLLLGRLAAFPRAILAPMVILSGVVLARAARDRLRGPPAVAVLGGALLTVTHGATAGFLAALLLHLATVLAARTCRAAP